MPEKISETIISIDYGKTNIGLALGKNGFVAPLKIISGKNFGTAAKEINRLSIENNVSKFVIGLPLTSEGKETEQTREIKRFGKLLKIFSRRPVEYHPENETTKEAIKDAISRDVPPSKRKQNDHLAAAILLKRYFGEKEDTREPLQT